MATSPNYEGAKRAGSLILSSSSSTSASAAVVSGVAAGTRVKAIRLCSGPATAPGTGIIVVILRDDGVNVIVIDVVTLTNAADKLQAVMRYDDVYLPTTAHSIKFQMRTALPSGATLHCAVDVADF